MLRIIFFTLLPLFIQAQECTITVKTQWYTLVTWDDSVSIITDTTDFVLDEGTVLELHFLFTWNDSLNYPTVENAIEISPFRWKVSCGALPVEIYEFAGYPQQRGVNILTWRTGIEDQFNYFDLERSDNGLEWYYYKRIDSKGSGSNYEIPDTHAIGNKYYRLKMVDIDQSFRYSPTIFIKGDYQPVLLPNPMKKSYILPTLYQITDRAGRYVGTSLNYLPSGYYIFTTTDGLNYSQPILIVD